MDKIAKKEKKEKIFVKSDFIEKEAEEEDDNKKLKKLDSAPMKDTQYSTDGNNEEDSYGISSDNDTEKIDNKQIVSHRILLNKEKLEKENKVEIKRKRKPEFEKNNKRKRILKQLEKNSYKVERQLGIINGKLNICFDENRENKDINIGINNNITPEKKFKDEDDEDFIKLKMSNERKKISDLNKINNKDFIQRMKDNEKFIKNSNIIINDGSKRSKSQIIKRKKEKGTIHPKLKLFNLKGAFLNKKKK